MANVRKLCSLALVSSRCLRGIPVSASPISKIGPMINVTQIRTKFNPHNPGLIGARSGVDETDEEMDKRYLNYFNKPDIDGWELRKGINDMQTMDLVPEPEIMKAVLHACRRVNEHSVAIRYLEAVKAKANDDNIWNYLMQEIRPTLSELGISTLEEMGYHVPELALGDPERTPLIEKP